MRLLLALALALLASGASLAQAPAARDVSILVYHVSPDPAAGTSDADPFSRGDTGFLQPDDALRLPLTRIDRVAYADEAPEGDPASASARFQEVRRVVQDRQRQGSPLEMTLDVRIEGARVVSNLSVRPIGPAPTWILSLAYAEDGIPYAAEGGTRLARFVPSGVTRPDGAAGNLSSFEAGETTGVADLSRLVVLGIAEDAATGEVLQSAAWVAGQQGPTVQRSRAVLVEHLTATWCAPCAPSDAAIDLLASQYGFPPPDADLERSYWRPATPAALVGLGMGAAAGIALARRRRE